jgi:very-short-patch-repair endonuclease
MLASRRVLRFADGHRAEQTPGELLMAEWLADLGVPVAAQIAVGRWIFDFVDLECAVVYEVDGRHHRRDPAQADADAERDALVARAGLRVVRVSNSAPRRRSKPALARIAKARRLAPRLAVQVDPEVAAGFRAGFKAAGYRVPKWARRHR